MSNFAFDNPSRIQLKVVSQSVASGSPNSVTPQLLGGALQFVTVPSSLGTFTLNAPNLDALVNAFPIHASEGNYVWYMRLLNSSGGNLTVTLASAYTTVTPTYPANGKTRFYKFLYDGSKHLLMTQSAADLG